MPSLGRRVLDASAQGKLVVQPRMGFDDPAIMAAGLLATRKARAETVGTLTLDSYTRTRDYTGLSQALAANVPLNGYPLATIDPQVTRDLLRPVLSAEFPVQVRHGSPDPRDIVDAMLAVGLTATEGGPVSYSLPYGRTPIADALVAWREACRRLADVGEHGEQAAHLESFGGCVLGQLCPPSLLVAISVLEAVFFTECGITDVSLSYAQQANAAQDEEALYALRQLALEFLPSHLTWHIVLYSYMGVFPRTPEGAALLVERSAELAARTGTERLIVKTAAEAYRIPSIEDNVVALEAADRAAAMTVRAAAPDHARPSQTYAEAKALITATLNLRGDAGSSLVAAFERGYLDVPFCLHPDNLGATQSYLGPDGWLGWSDIGRMPLAGIAEVGAEQALTARGLLKALSYVQEKHDREGETAHVVDARRPELDR
jgi:methylaspartate mutase epsilon subunit